MTDFCENLSQVPGYLLSEESHERLQRIRDHLFLMAVLTVAATLQEENEAPLEIRRSMLADCFDGIGTQIDDVLGTLTSTSWLSKRGAGPH